MQNIAQCDPRVAAMLASNPQAMSHTVMTMMANLEQQQKDLQRQQQLQQQQQQRINGVVNNSTSKQPNRATPNNQKSSIISNSGTPLAVASSTSTNPSQTSHLVIIKT